MVILNSLQQVSVESLSSFQQTIWCKSNMICEVFITCSNKKPSVRNVRMISFQTFSSVNTEIQLTVNNPQMQCTPHSILLTPVMSHSTKFAMQLHDFLILIL
jgi:hypothetical protein